MNITVEIKAPELVSAIHALAKALEGGQAFPIASAPVAVTKEESTKVSKAKQEVKEEEKAVEPPFDMKGEVEDAPKSAPIKLEVVRSKLATIAQSGKQNEVKEILSMFGAKKLTDIDPEHFEALLAAAEKL